MPIDRRLLFNIDWGLLAAVLILIAIGVATILSATVAGRQTGLEIKQLYAIALGLIGMVVVISLDYRRLVDRAPLLYLLVMGVLVYLLLLGPQIEHTRRWIMGPGGFRLQPSEFAKLVAALLVAKIFAESKKETLGLVDVVAPGAAVATMVLLIAAEPDLGTAFTLVPLFFTVAFLAGLRVRSMLALVPAVMLLGAIWWQYIGKPYQKERVEIFLGIKEDPKGAGYQKIQSEIAVGSGGVVGKGYKRGTQSQLGYLPARHTDFIFSVMAEENGFLGVVVVLGLYMFVLWRAFETAQMARDRVGAFLSAGIGAVLAFQVIYNVAMVAGLVPVKGLPLPLMSYGGSSAVSSLLAVGLILNVRMRRFAN